MEQQVRSDRESFSIPRWFMLSPFVGPGDAPPPAVPAEMSFGVQSRKGRSNSANDNHYVVVRLGRYQETVITSLPDGEIPALFGESAYGMALADGMGPAGEAASRLALSTLVYLAICFGRSNVRIDEAIADEVMDRAERFYRSIDSTLLQVGSDKPLGLQTALTGIYSAGQQLFFAHVGRSRAYLFRDDQLLQLTRDDEADRAAAGAAATAKSPASHSRMPCDLVTETLGGPRGGNARITVERCSLVDGDVVLLSTRALTDVVDDAEIAGALRLHREPDDQCRALVDLAQRACAEDDVTALVAHYRLSA